ncbi:DUF1615 domain-containing protein [Oleiagrimonas sp. C23AA]|uniref:DUF1615 domain-containing protein n=1 Tax=Oleiagrimonas sp. C23AA TaxID=2719047 RepID=UPI00141DCFA4|nr:DUF1615 domain-containing protein [Oleiagrimonas sp. C23AA]NII09707.1 DUF1615 domain-containing protein [Oleiagrimonas sp. C23AA]
MTKHPAGSASRFPIVRKRRTLFPFVLLALLAGCATQRTVQRPQRRPAQVRAQIVHLLPGHVSDKPAWATDIYAAFAAQRLDPDTSQLCQVIAVTAQESGFRVHPVVPNLPHIARKAIDERASKAHVPQFLVRAALWLKSPNGQRYSQRIAQVKTEQQMSELFEDFIGMVPLGKHLFGDLNPVHTAGPMQVSVDFAKAHAQRYPYPVPGSIRSEVFTRRGGMYFGIANLLGNPVAYPSSLYRFADYNAGWFASRNAAFQHAVSVASGIALALDGDLVVPDAGFDAKPGATERAVRSLRRKLRMSDGDIHAALEQGNASVDFAGSRLYRRVFALADHVAGKPQPRAMLPRITLHSPKISRKLTTAWFARRVDHRYQQCLARAH